jgi:chromosome segregation ATPase
MNMSNIEYVKELCGADRVGWVCEQLAKDLDTRDKRIKELEAENQLAWNDCDKAETEARKLQSRIEAGLNCQHLIQYIQKLEGQIVELQRKYDALMRDFAVRMETAADDIEDWGVYASEYFQQKHGLKTELQRYRNKAKELRALLEDDDE